MPYIIDMNPLKDRVIAGAISRRCLTSAAYVRVQVSSCWICRGQSGNGAGSFRPLGFPLPFHRLQNTHHPSCGAGTIGQILADVPSGLNLTQSPRN
jgi:hypothetical protein